MPVFLDCRAGFVGCVVVAKRFGMYKQMEVYMNGQVGESSKLLIGAAQGKILEQCCFSGARVAENNAVFIIRNGICRVNRLV